MNKRKGLAMLVLATFLLAGYSSAQQTIAELKSELNKDVLAPEDTQIAQQDQSGLEVPSIDDIHIEETYQPVPTAAENNVPQMTVALYFASADGDKLIKEEKDIPKVEGMARATVETLLEGPTADSGLRSAIPAGTQLLDINVKPDSGLCIVDFSKEITSVASDISEEVTVYAIANTLCQFPTISQVEFRVEGQAVTTLDGQTDLSKAVSANADIVTK